MKTVKNESTHFKISQNRCPGSCNTLDFFSNKICVSEDLNLSLLNIIAGTNESKILKKHISCKRKFKFVGRICNSHQKWSDNKC